MSVRVAEDRSLCVQPKEVVKTAWINIDLCVLGNRTRMTPEAVEKKWRMLLQQGEGARWPCPNGYWREDGRFVVCDGRHEYLASLMHGREQLLVAWLERSVSTELKQVS